MVFVLRRDSLRTNACGRQAGLLNWQAKVVLPSGAMWRRHSFFQVPASKERTAEDIRARLQRVEAVLFIAKEPLTSRKISELADLEDGTEARTLVKRLNRTYDQLGHAMRIESVAGGNQLVTRPAFANWLRKLDHLPAELRLSAPAFETLTVVAYRQPVIRADIDAIRGVNCGEILKQLMDRDLIRISGRSEELGRPFLYSTTKHFLKCFGLNNLESLPRAERMQRPAEATLSTRNETPRLVIVDGDLPESDESSLEPDESLLMSSAENAESEVSENEP